jgi:ribosome-binding factor A
MSVDRMRQVNELIHRAVSEIIAQDIELPLDVFVTITNVDTSRDLKYARVYVTVLPDHKRVSTIKLLERRLGLIQKLLGTHVRLRSTPKIQFFFDEGTIRAQHIYDVFDKDS